MYEEVYGETFNAAKSIMAAIQERINQHTGLGFDSEKACAEWAHECHLDIIAYIRARQSFYFVTHKGAIVNPAAWKAAYCEDLLFYKVVTEDKIKKVKWEPTGHKYYDKARITTEQSDGIYEPLYHRDYFTPTGFFDETTGTFNIAKPFPVFAKQTGRDTSHIYRYIEHVAGECAPWLLAWLRAKMIHPKEKTQIVPIIVSRAQGTGKSTFAEVICKGLFGKDNVLVTDQYDSQSRFNADYADALIVCHEEKEETDRKNPAASIKSRATATQIRKENKGLDPVYQDSYTEFIITTNKDVPIKFDDRADQRRFMVMQADDSFTRKTSELADEVFTKLYGCDKNMNHVGVPFSEDAPLIAQFKHELYNNKELENLELRNFPKTAAYHRCFTMPRTTENTEIESILRSVAPFIKQMLEDKQHVKDIEVGGETISLSDIIQTPIAIQYFAPQDCVILCRPAVFYDVYSGKPFNHATVERTLIDSDDWLVSDFGVKLMPDMTPIPGGFYGIQGRNRNAPAARFCLVKNYNSAAKANFTAIMPNDLLKQSLPDRIGERFRVNNRWQPDEEGEFETVNELIPGTQSLADKTQSCQYLDTFLFEADSVSKDVYRLEEDRVRNWIQAHGSAFDSVPIKAQKLFSERLKLQLAEATRLYKNGIACRVVYSGSKSYHILVRVKDAPTTVEEYKWLHAHLATILSDKLDFDPVNSDPGRLTRSPVVKERVSTYMGVNVVGTQAPIYTCWSNVFDYSWRPLYKQWLDRPPTKYAQFDKKMIPTKQEYIDAMYALLEGKFFKDPVWNGRRQQCFFPAYRLARYIGYSHEALWGDGGILDGIDSYYKHNEINYWKSRESSKLISQIDEEIDGWDQD